MGFFFLRLPSFSLVCLFTLFIGNVDAVFCRRRREGDDSCQAEGSTGDIRQCLTPKMSSNPEDDLTKYMFRLLIADEKQSTVEDVLTGKPFKQAPRDRKIEHPRDVLPIVPTGRWHRFRNVFKLIGNGVLSRVYEYRERMGISTAYLCNSDNEPTQGEIHILSLRQSAQHSLQQLHQGGSSTIDEMEDLSAKTDRLVMKRMTSLAFDFVREQIRVFRGGFFRSMFPKKNESIFAEKNSDEFSNMYILTMMKSEPEMYRETLSADESRFAARFEVKFQKRGAGVLPGENLSIKFESGLAWTKFENFHVVDGLVIRDFEIIDNSE